jgi:hypothetical protein
MIIDDSDFRWCVNLMLRIQNSVDMMAVKI